MMTVVLSVGLGVLAGCLLLALLSYDGTVSAVATHVAHRPARVDSMDELFACSDAAMKDMIEAGHRDDDAAGCRLDVHYES